MNREDIIKLARDNGLRMSVQGSYFFIGFDDLGALLDAATATEREACAKVCDGMVMYGPVAEVQQRYNKAYADCRDAIRARGIP